MGRPTDLPRLRDLDPSEVADSVVDAVAAHIERLAIALSPSSAWDLVPELRRSTLWCEAHALTVWAQTGQAWDWTDSGMAADGLASVCAALYAYPAQGVLEVPVLDSDADADTDYGTVILAASARIAICQGRDVAVRQLSALASLGPDALLKGEGAELRRISRGQIDGEDARRWLSGRGIVIERELPRPRRR